MFTVRQPQLQQMQLNSLDNYIKKIMVSAKERLPTHCAQQTDTELWELIRASIHKAAGFDITETDDVALFIDLAIVHSLDFDTLEDFVWAVPVLSSKSHGGSVKIAVLYDRLPARLHPSTAAPRRTQ